jgi:hypothetical protein
MAYSTRKTKEEEKIMMYSKCAKMKRQQSRRSGIFLIEAEGHL